MTINAHTKIASLLKQHPGALEAIVSISEKFSKLRNPILRKVIAGRTSILVASKLGGCKVEDFFNKLQPLGFVIDNAVAVERDRNRKPTPGFLNNIEPGKIVDLDVRPVIENSKDPLNIILQKVRALEQGSVLKIINSFEPVPLVNLLAKQGFQVYTEVISDELVHTYFFKDMEQSFAREDKSENYSEGWDEVLNRFTGNIERVDVRALKMPLPMQTILEALEKLPAGKALFVYHKRIPVFLLPELEEQQLNYRVKEISDDEVWLLIYRD